MPTAMVVMTNIPQSCLQSQFQMIIGISRSYNSTGNLPIPTSPLHDWILWFSLRLPGTRCNSTVETSPLTLGIHRPRYVFRQSKTLQVYSLLVFLLCHVGSIYLWWLFSSLSIKLKTILPKVQVASSHDLSSQFSYYSWESNLTPGCSTTLLLAQTTEIRFHGISPSWLRRYNKDTISQSQRL